MKQIKLTLLTALNTFILYIFTGQIALAESTASYNSQLQRNVGKQIKEVLDVWINVAAASMILVIISGAAMLILSGNDPRMKTAGKSTVLGAGVTITLLYSIYIVVEMILRIFGMSLF